MSCKLDQRTFSVSNQHLGHLFLDCMLKYPGAVCQIDAATGEEENNESVLHRSVQVARSFRNYGLVPGDVLCVGGRNHLDLHIPFFAALLNGLPVTGVDPYFKYNEIKNLFQLARPKIAFCDEETYEMYVDAIQCLGLDTKVVIFGNSESANSMKVFIDKYNGNEAVEDFKAADFDQEKVYAFLVSTSGTGGRQKLAAIKHGILISKMKKYIAMTASADTGSRKIGLNLSPINWISGLFNAIGLPLMRHTKLQTSKSNNLDHIIELINKYKPQNTLMSPTLMSTLLSRKDVDLSCFRVVTVTGSKPDPGAMAEFRKLLHKDAALLEAYGMTETIGPCLAPNPMGPPGSCGRIMPTYQVKLVDPETGKEVADPNVSGELWVKGESFSEFYNDPEETARSHSEDGFFKTGDLLYRDENYNFFYVDRLKSLIKFRNSHILPGEIEDVIRTHPAVYAVCVCGAPHPTDGQRPVACVVPRDGCDVSAQQIKELVASNLSKNKELSGGVVFLKEIPMTSTDKIARTKLLNIISNLTPE